MASKFLTNIDLNQNELINATFQVVPTNPTEGNFEGRMIYNSTTDSILVYGNGAWRKFVNSITKGGSYTDAITISESNGEVTLTLNLANTDDAGLLSAEFWNALNDATSDATASKLVKRDANGNIKVATPTDAAHAATKGYVDAARQGLDVKQSVRAATTGPVNLSTELEAGDTIDTSVTLVAGDRVLVKNQGTASENGIYVVQSSGAPVRATDANGTADTGTVSGGTFTFVEEGTVNADSGWVVSTNGPITVGSDPMNWVQFSGAGSIIAGAGLSKDGNTINVGGTSDRITVNSDTVDIASTYVGQTSITTLGTITTGTWNGTDIAVADGGTGSSTASGARTNLADTSTSGQTTSTPVLARIAKQGCAASSGITSTTTVTHNFGTTDVIVQVYEVGANNATVFGDVTRVNGNTVSVVLNGSTIAANDYTIVVTG
jgi:hypothetical protein